VRKGADLYAVLGVPASATADELKAAYRELARRHHPDHARTYLQRIAATRRMQAINAAYAVLRDPQRRAAYDAERPDVAPSSDDRSPAGPENGGMAEPWSGGHETPATWALGMVLAGAAVLLLVSGRAHWSLAVLLLLAQLAYCHRTDCIDDWIWGLGVGFLAFWWALVRMWGAVLPAFLFPHGIDAQVALVAASGVTAIFIGIRQFRRRRLPWL
jgi:hypothetical protein